MKKVVLIILPVIAFVAGFLIFYLNRPLEQKAINLQTNQQVDNLKKWETKISEQQNVSVVVTPKDLSPESVEWKFDVGMNTHSVELNQDMMKSAILIDDQGREYSPIKWEGPDGGHHREGLIIFNKISPTPKSVKLKIINLGIAREFTWNL